jgi:recombination protein RecA
VVDLGSELGVIEKSGAWYSCQGERIGQGRDNARTYLEQHPEMMAWVEARILEKHGLKRGAPEAEPEAALAAADKRPRAKA